MTPLPRHQNLTIGDALQEALRLDQLGRYDEAQKLCQQVLKAKPDLMDAHHVLGVVALHAGKPVEAVRHLKQALKLQPSAVEVAFNLSKAYFAQAKWIEMAATLETVHSLWPDRASILIDMGYALEKAGNENAAIDAYQRALQLDPGAAQAHSNLGAVFTRIGHLAEAQAHLNHALTTHPTMATALMNLAMLHESANRPADALAAYDRLLEKEPEHVYAHFQRALALMAQGRLRDGWDEYIWRFQRPHSATLHNAFPYPIWNGEALEGRRILIWTEQGPGDEILLASMLPDVLELCEDVSLVCSARLAPVFRRSFPDIDVISADRLGQVEKKGKPDVQASFSHLGAILRPTLESFPPREKYLVADPVKRQKLRATYQGNTGTKLVGIAWHSANAIAERNKSIALDAWIPLLKSIDATFISLQYGEHIHDAKRISQDLDRPIIIDRSVNPLQDMDAFVAQVGAMDAVVSVSNTTVHVAGALGVPTVTMIPAGFGRIWYWFRDRDDSPWYPSARLFQQQSATDWGHTLNAATGALKQILGA